MQVPLSRREEERWKLEKIRNLNDDELKRRSSKTAEQLFRLRFQMKLGQNEGVKKLRELQQRYCAHQDHRPRARAAVCMAKP